MQTIVIRGTDGKWFETSGNLPPITPSDRPPYYGLRADLRVRRAADSRVVGLEALEFTASQSGTGASVSTSLEVPEGRQVVVGRATLGESAIILVMNARFID